MKELHYIAKLQNGALVEGVAEFTTAEALAQRLHETGLELVNIKTPRQWLKIGERRMNDKESATLARDLAMIVKSGVSLSDGLRDLGTHSNEKNRAMFHAIADRVESGLSLAESLEAQNGKFTNEFLAAVRAGERSGSLDTTFLRLADHLEWRDALRAQVIPALAYPAGLVLASVALVGLVALYLVPNLAAPLEKMHAKLPWITSMVLDASRFAQDYGFQALGACVTFILAFFIYRATAAGREWTDAMILKIPIVGPLLLRSAGADFASTLGTLYRAGLPLNESLELIEKSSRNRAVAMRLRTVREEVVAGGGLAEAANRSLQFPPLVARMLSLGERTGSLEESLERISQQLERELHQGAKRLLAIGEPAAILIAGGGIGVAIFAAILPLFRMIESAHN